MNKKLAEIIRVNQAGEKGATVIYQTQARFARNLDAKMHATDSLLEEKEHLDYFNNQIKSRSIRPTALDPIWKIGAFAIGGISAIFGSKAVMAATEAVEEVIVEHYDDQLQELKANFPQEKDLIENIEKFRNEEQKHLQEAINMGSNQMIGYSIFYNITKKLTKTVIQLAKKI